MRTINDPEKWPILPEMIKSEEQPETAATGESHVEKSVNTESPTNAPAEPESTKLMSTKTEPAKTNPTKNETTKPESM